MGNVEPLKCSNTHILVRTYQDREPRRQTARRNRKRTDSLTKAGYELFDVLRKLRLAIAREEGVPPYIIFSDKTLIDMSAKAPRDRTAMLNVSGVGEAKHDKYGDRFIEAIIAFLDDNPDSITSIEDNGAVSEEDKQLDEEYHSGMNISSMDKTHDRTNGAIRARLKKHGIIE